MSRQLGAGTIKVAVVGGGAASIAAAFELSRPEHRGRYRVTVYQLGWRLGGKGASGRGPSGRIEEHGLHLWFGFYENAFRLLRECYAELGRDKRTCPFADWEDAFVPAPWVGNMDVSRRGEWLSRVARFISAEGLPGDDMAHGSPFSIGAYLARMAALTRTLMMGVETLGPQARPLRPVRSPSPPSLDALLGNLAEIVRQGVMMTTTAIVQSLALLEVALTSWPLPVPGVLLRPVEIVVAAIRDGLARLAFDEQNRFRVELTDVLCAIMLGTLRAGVLADPRGFDAIDDYEFREWLHLNGAAETSLQSAFMHGLYDLPLAYENGNPQRPALAAGQGLRGFFRMFFGHRGPFAWKMRAGMGDVVFAPFYEVLRRRGVAFRFFHRLENVGIAGPAGSRYVERLDFAVQAETANGRGYLPLIDVNGLPCWPSRPDFTQLKDGARLRAEEWEFESAWDRRSVGRRSLRVTRDFDFVVLGVSIGEIARVCRQILAVDVRWRAMVENVKTVATQAFQVWLRTDLQSTGWLSPSPTVAAFVKPFDSWADMSQVLPYEQWAEMPGSVAYFCSVLPDPPLGEDMTDRSYPVRRRAEVRDNAVRFLKSDVRHLWPKAMDGGGDFRWQLLAADSHAGPHGEARFDTQFWTANVNPSDRYVLSLPGSNRYRISPLDRTYDNLTIAGDWTDCGLNLGCVEAAVMSGRLAAHALSLSPALEEIVGYDHP